MQKFFLSVLVFCCLLAVPACYTLSGISISPEVQTFYVGQLTNNAVNAPPTLSQDMSETLKQKIQNESRLRFADTDPDVEFTGTIVDFRVSSEAPTAGTGSAINRLTILTSIEFTNHREQGKNWKKNFSFFFDFGANQDLASIQSNAIQRITEQISEDIFNQAFTDW